MTNIFIYTKTTERLSLFIGSKYRLSYFFYTFAHLKRRIFYIFKNNFIFLDNLFFIS